MKKSRLYAFWNRRVKEIKLQTYALYYASRDPRVPWYAKGFTALIVAYAFSPIDLIPDFIPVLGYLDDLVIIPLGIFLALKMVPKHVMLECQERARTRLSGEKPNSKYGVFLIIGVWLIAILVIGLLGMKAFHLI